MNEKLNALTSEKLSGWKAKAEYRKANRDWLNKSGEIALRVLRELKTMGITQREFAERINVTPQYVSNLLKGEENLSLETICKLENALGISLIAISSDCITVKMDVETTYFDQSRLKKCSGKVKAVLPKDYTSCNNSTLKSAS